MDFLPGSHRISNRNGYESFLKNYSDKFKNHPESTDSSIGAMVLSLQVPSKTSQGKK